MTEDKIVLGDPVHGLMILPTFNPNFDVVFMRMKDGFTAGGVVYTQFSGTAIELHASSWDHRWLNRDMGYITFDYPFQQLGVKKIFGPVSASNEAGLEFVRKLGFKEEARLRDATPEGDIIVHSMYREDCKFLHLRPRGPIVHYQEGHQDGRQV